MLLLSLAAAFADRHVAVVPVALFVAENASLAAAHFHLLAAFAAAVAVVTVQIFDYAYY